MNPRRYFALLALPALACACAYCADDSLPPDFARVIGESPSASAVFELGGWAMWPILGAAIIGLVLIVERLYNLRRERHAPKNFHKDIVKIVDMRGVDAALALCLEKTSSISRVLYAALLRHGTARQEMEAAIIDEGRRVLYDLRRNSRPIGVLSLVAPLIGLLGACVSAIRALDEAGAMEAGRAAVLVNGGARALVPLAFGLLVAIPLAVFYFYLRGKASDVARDVEELAIDAVITLDRKARQSIRLIEDIEEQIETQDMPGIRAPDLDKEFEDSRGEGSGLKTSITTHAGQASSAAAAAAASSATAPSPSPSASASPSSSQAGAAPPPPPAPQKA